MSLALMLAEAKRDAGANKSFRMHGRILPRGDRFTFAMGRSVMAASVRTRNFRPDIRTIGPVAYVRLGAGPWLRSGKGSADVNLKSVLGIGSIVRHLIVMPPLVSLPQRDLHGVQVVGVRGLPKKKLPGTSATLWVTTGAHPLPVEYDVRKPGGRQLLVDFSGWGKRVHVQPPASYTSVERALAGRTTAVPQAPLYGVTPACPVVVPAGASATARKYAALLNSEDARRVAISDGLAANGGITRTSDMVAETAVDTDFRNGVRAIPFTGAAAQDAARLVAVLSQYLDFLSTSESDSNYYASNHDYNTSLENSRHEAAAALRADLGLPPSTCNLLRP